MLSHRCRIIHRTPCSPSSVFGSEESIACNLSRLSVVKSNELVLYQVIEESKYMQKSEDTELVIKVPREPAIIINGVPDLPREFTSGSQLAVREAISMLRYFYVLAM
ncbi:hypothetical protein ZWY2020_016173 [Hordeum vulgare]|nr:hypothetical protein ZWY2020_016173 [Hordeum vulgare]